MKKHLIEQFNRAISTFLEGRDFAYELGVGVDSSLAHLGEKDDSV